MNHRQLLVAVLASAWLLGIAPGASGASPTHPSLFEIRGFLTEPGHVASPPPEGNIEDACGVAVDSAGDIYVSDYYHRTVDVYGRGPTHEYLTQIADPDPDGPCNLAVDAEGNVYVNNWRRDVLRFAPSHFPPTSTTTYGPPTVLDLPTAAGARSTGVFWDPTSGSLYVDDRSYVAIYEASELGATEPTPAQVLGLGSLGEGYGVAVSDFPATAGEVYVPDATTGTVKVYDPATSTTTPVGDIDGAGTPQRGFSSLADSDVGVDQTDGHVFVADDLEPGFETPAAVVDEFNPTGAYRGQLPQPLVEARPSAIALDQVGDVYVTSGNTEGAAVYGLGPTVPGGLVEVGKSGAGTGEVTSEPAGIACGTACAAEYDRGEEVTLTATPGPGSAFEGWSGCGQPSGARCKVPVGVTASSVTAEFEPVPQSVASLFSPALPSSGEEATAAVAGATSTGPPARTTRGPTAKASEVVQKQGLRLSLGAALKPRALPRQGTAPVTVSLDGRISSPDGSEPPQLRTISIAINKEARFDFAGLPTCSIARIQPASDQAALAACGESLVGDGTLTADVKLPQSSPFPSEGKILAFNGRVGGRPAILAHVYGTEPIPTSYTLAFLVGQAHGTFGTTLTASLPQVTGEWGFVTGITLTLRRTFRRDGKVKGYVSAGCPAPQGFPSTVFPLVQARFSFAGSATLGESLQRTCRAINSPHQN